MEGIPARFESATLLGRTALVAGACLLSTSVLAQEGVEAQLAEQKAINADLEERLATLEARDTGPGFGMGVEYGDVTAKFQVFGDVGALYANPDMVGDANAFASLGSATFFTTARMGERMRILSETVLDADSSGGVSADQERLWGSWTFDDMLYAKLGVEHSPISRWNQLNHHGRWLETTIERPFLASFEGGQGFLPLHRTGVELGGTAHLGSGRVEYFCALSNGRGIDPGDKQRAFDTDDPKDLDLGLAFMPECIPDLRVGAALTLGHIPDDPASADPLRARSIGETIATAHVEYSWGELEILSEFAVIEHETNAGNRSFSHTSAYLQLAYALGDWTPYVRTDFRNMRMGDPFYAPSDRDLDAWKQILGFRYDLTRNAAFKFELGLGQEDVRRGSGAIAEEDVVSAAAQLSWWL